MVYEYFTPSESYLWFLNKQLLFRLLLKTYFFRAQQGFKDDTVQTVMRNVEEHFDPYDIYE